MTRSVHILTNRLRRLVASLALANVQYSTYSHNPSKLELAQALGVARNS